MAAAQTASSDRQWFIVGRWQQYEGEARANLLRIVAVGAFYVVQVIHYYGFSDRSPQAQEFHSAATMLTVAWSLLALAVLLCLRRHIFPAALKYVSTLCDICLLTSLAAMGGKADSPLVLAYFLIVAMAGLRFSLGLVWFAALASMAGYEFLVGQGDDVWFDADHKTPVVNQLVTLLSLGLTGILLGQIIRRVRSLADDYARRLQSGGSPP